jgi:hypothetical protein
LNFHDPRLEVGSRFLEHGMAPHYVQAFLDHANLSTTSQYLNITSQGMHAAVRRVEKSRSEKIEVVSDGKRTTPLETIWKDRPQPAGIRGLLSELHPAIYGDTHQRTRRDKRAHQP